MNFDSFAAMYEGKKKLYGIIFRHLLRPAGSIHEEVARKVDLAKPVAIHPIIAAIWQSEGWLVGSCTYRLEKAWRNTSGLRKKKWLLLTNVITDSETLFRFIPEHMKTTASPISRWGIGSFNLISERTLATNPTSCIVMNLGIHLILAFILL